MCVCVWMEKGETMGSVGSGGHPGWFGGWLMSGRDPTWKWLWISNDFTTPSSQSLSGWRVHARPHFALIQILKNYPSLIKALLDSSHLSNLTNGFCWADARIASRVAPGCNYWSIVCMYGMIICQRICGCCCLEVWIVRIGCTHTHISIAYSLNFGICFVGFT